MTRPREGDAEELADAIDVHVLDITAQIEALLRGVREVQRGVLNIHRSARGTAEAPRATVAAAVSSRLAVMLTDCDSLKAAVADAAERAGDLLSLVARDAATEPN